MELLETWSLFKVSKLQTKKNYSPKIWKDNLIIWQNPYEHWNLPLRMVVPVHFQTSVIFYLFSTLGKI